MTSPVSGPSPSQRFAEEARRRLGMALPSGSLLAEQFEVLDLIGQPGGFGITYLCRDLKLGRTVVVKELFPVGLVTRVGSSAQVQVVQPQRAAQFALQCELLLDEARRLAALEQVDGVVIVHDHFSANGTGYIVMQHVFGRPLSALLREAGGKVDAAQLMQWLWPLLAGLEAVHDSGVLHRDIKPDNLLVDQRGRPVLIDFGNAVARDAEAAGRELTGALGFYAVSPHYGAPEQYANDLDRMGAWTDLYSLGALMYTALAGQPPTDARKRLAGEALPELATLAPQTPPLLLAAVQACLRLDERQRPADVRALRALLAPLQPAPPHWLQLLPDDDLGRRMRGIQAMLQAGRSLPKRWNLASGAGQSLWFFAHRLPLAGALSALFTLAVSALLLRGADPWPRLPWAFGCAWLLAFVPCALLADPMRFRRMDLIGTAMPLGNEAQQEQARAALAAQGRLDGRLALLGLLMPALLLLLTAALHERQAGVQRQVEQAVQLTGPREAFASFVQQQGRPPGAGEWLPFTPNSEVRGVELRPTGLEVVLALPELEGRRLRWTWADGRWSCRSVDLPPRFAPASCP